MKRFFVVLSVVWFLGGCSLVSEYAGKNDLVGKPIQKSEVAAIPSYLKVVVANESKFWIVIMGINSGRYILRPCTFETFSLNRKGAAHYVAHAWHQSYIDEKGNIRFKDFAGEVTFSIFLGNEEKSYYGEKVGDIVTFSDNSFSFNPRYPYPRRYLHGPHWWQNFSAQEFFMDYP